MRSLIQQQVAKKPATSTDSAPTLQPQPSKGPTTQAHTSSVGNLGNQAVHRRIYAAQAESEYASAHKPRREDTPEPIAASIPLIRRKRCKAKATIVPYDKQGKRCNARIKMNVVSKRCVKQCSDSSRLAETKTFGEEACKKFCIKEKAHYSRFKAAKSCTSKSCDLKSGECPSECPDFDRCNASPPPNQWNCQCGCVRGIV